jgi:hypothetical protein
MKIVTKVVALLAGLSTALLLSVGFASTATAKPSTAMDPTAAPVAGTLAGGTVNAVTGTFEVQKFVVQNGALQAVGAFTGTVTNTATGGVTSGTQQVTLPINLAASTGSCQILDLVLGPLDLNLLGLQVHLDTVHLNITAQSGPGNLLGNLLCAVAGLLDGPTGLNAILTQITALLNQLLGILG